MAEDITLGELGRRIERLETQVEKMEEGVNKRIDEAFDRWRRWMLMVVGAVLTPTAALVIQAIARK